MSQRMNETEATLRAELRTVLARAEETGDLDRLEELQRIVAAERGKINPSVELQLECDLEALRSRHRPVAESVLRWERLAWRARQVLPGDDPAQLRIRSFHARYVRRRGRPGDQDEGVRMYRKEWDRRRALFDDDDPRTGVARANYALALRERGAADDLERALQLLEDETLLRLDRYGSAHPFTWKAQVVLAQTQIRAAEGSDDPAERERRAQEAMEIAEALLHSRRRRYGVSDQSTLHAHLVHAQALLLLGQADHAVREIHGVRQTACRPSVTLDPGWVELLLARSLATDDPANALEYAREALRLREAYYSGSSRQVAEVLALIAELGGRA